MPLVDRTFAPSDCFAEIRPRGHDKQLSPPIDSMQSDIRFTSDISIERKAPNMWNGDEFSSLVAAQTSWTLEKRGDCLEIVNDEGLSALIFGGERQILVETALFPASSVLDKASLDDLILRSHHLVPLSTVSISKIGTEDFYVAFGALSTESQASVVLEEVETLFENTGEFLELYGEFLKSEDVA